MLEDEGVPLSPARRGQQHGRVDERVLVDEVEEVLEEARERAAVDGAGDDEQVGLFDANEFLLDAVGQLAAVQGARELGADLRYLDEVHVDVDAFTQLGDDAANERRRLTGLVQASRHGNDSQAGRHVFRHVSTLDPPAQDRTAGRNTA